MIRYREDVEENLDNVESEQTIYSRSPNGVLLCGSLSCRCQRLRSSRSSSSWDLTMSGSLPLNLSRGVFFSFWKTICRFPSPRPQRKKFSLVFGNSKVTFASFSLFPLNCLARLSQLSSTCLSPTRDHGTSSNLSTSSTTSDRSRT